MPSKNSLVIWRLDCKRRDLSSQETEGLDIRYVLPSRRIDVMCVYCVPLDDGMC